MNLLAKYLSSFGFQGSRVFDRTSDSLAMIGAVSQLTFRTTIGIFLLESAILTQPLSKKMHGCCWRVKKADDCYLHCSGRS